MRDSFLLAAQQKQSNLTCETKIAEAVICPETRNRMPMVIEWLKIPVPSARQDDYLRHDTAIWTQILSKQPGFTGKEVWRDPDSPDILHLVIRWDSYAHWQAVPETVLAAADRAFCSALGDSFPVALCTRYDVAEPPV
jgi:uncharacterized protein (TIGR03792 family)